MSPDSDLIKLYSQRILALAADMPRTDRLADPSASVKRRSPLCGSTVTVDVLIKGDVVQDYGQEVKACALGQAAASVVGASIIGCTQTQVVTARDELLAMLKGQGPAPSAPFNDLEVLLPAADYKNRHASVMLALEASVEAFATAKAQQSA